MEKIAFLVPWFPAWYQTFIINQIVNACDAGYEIRIFPRFYDELEDVSQPEICERYDIMKKVVRPIPFEQNKLKRIRWLINNLYRHHPELIRYFLKSLNPLVFGKNGVNLFVFRNLLQFYGNSDFDLFHCQYGTTGLIAAWLKELGLLRGKIITTFHGYDAHYHDAYLRQYYFSSIRTWAPVLFKHLDLITVNTPFLLKQVLRFGADPRKIELLPMGIDTTLFVPKDISRKSKKIKLLSVGRLVKWKGHDWGIRAAAALLKEDYHFEYSIIGDGVERDNLHKLIEKFGLTRHVRLLGAKNQTEIIHEMQTSDIFLMTSAFDEIGRREAQGVVTAEAQACGLPVVAFRSGGIPYTIEKDKTGYLAEENDLDEFVRHLKKLCDNEKLRMDMGRNARKFVEDHFCQTKLARKQIALYEMVIQQRSSVEP